MPFPSVTYTFSNSTTADATQVNQNFTDLLNGISDGTKNVSISALTAAGTATLQGNVTLGNSSSNTITANGSFGTSLVFSTTNTYDLGGSTIGVRSLYLADAGSAARATRLIGATIASAWTMTLPTSAGSNLQLLGTDGSGVTSWNSINSPMELTNIGISATVGSSNLTIALKQSDASTNATSSSPCRIGFRSSTAATGSYNQRTVTGALSLVINSGSTLGHASGVTSTIYVYVLDNAGTVELAASSSYFDDGSIISTTAEGGGAATSSQKIYSTTARSNVPIRLIGRMQSNQATAGTWASTMSEISLGGSLLQQRYPVVARYRMSSDTAVTANTTNINYDSKIFDPYNTVTTGAGTWVFTAPVSGYYLVKANGYSNSGGGTLRIFNNTGSGMTLYSAVSTFTTTQYNGNSILISMTAGDTLCVRCDSSVTLTADSTGGYPNNIDIMKLGNS